MKEIYNNKTKKIISDIELIKLCSCQTEEKFKEIISFIRHFVNVKELVLLDDQQEMQAQKAEGTPPE